MSKRFSIKSLLILTVAVAVGLTLYLFNPEAVRKRRFERGSYHVWEINRKIRIFEESNDSVSEFSATSLLADGIINGDDAEFLMEHHARFVTIGNRSTEIAVRMELLLANYRFLCFTDGSVSWFRENENGYQTMSLSEFWEIRESRRPRIY